MGFTATALDYLIAKGQPLQIGIRNAAQPFGPGTCERAFSDAELAKALEEGVSSDLAGYFRLFVEAQKQATPTSRPQVVVVPIVFHIDDVLMVLEAPSAKDEGAIITAAPGRGGGGLHIPGGS